LEWGQLPADLDLYALLPSTDGDHRIAYFNPGTIETSPWVGLKSDIKHGYGPEEIIVHKAMAGRYRFAVNRYSKDVPLAGCGATVTLTQQNGNVQTFNCPNVGEGDWWYVFDIDFTSNEIKDINVISDKPLE
jgi:uncharacterized protein YfaP (DUF2135 family)